MQSSNRFLDDLAKVANGAVATLAGLKTEIEAMIHQQMERWMAGANLVTRDEFEAMAEVARNARAAQEKLEARVAALEKAAGPKARPATAKPAPAPRRRPATPAPRKPAPPKKS